MIRTLRLIVAMTVFLAIYAFIVNPAIGKFFAAVEPFLSPGGGSGVSGILGTTETVLFLGMPLLLLGGILVLGFVVATGLRGTSR